MVRICRKNTKTLSKCYFSFAKLSPIQSVSRLQVISNVICSRALSNVEHVAVTVLIVAVCTAVSLAYDCLGVVLELNVRPVCSHVTCPASIFSVVSSWSSSTFPGCSKRHASDLHPSGRVLPQTLPRSLVSWR